MTDTEVRSRLDLTGKTITTYIIYEIHDALGDGTEGDRVEAITDALPAIDNDIRAWSRTTGNRLVEVTEHGRTRRYLIEKGPARRAERPVRVRHVCQSDSARYRATAHAVCDDAHDTSHDGRHDTRSSLVRSRTARVLGWVE